MKTDLDKIEAFAKRTAEPIPGSGRPHSWGVTINVFEEGQFYEKFFPDPHDNVDLYSAEEVGKYVREYCSSAEDMGAAIDFTYSATLLAPVINVNNEAPRSLEEAQERGLA